MKKFKIVFNCSEFECSADKMNISDGEITLYAGEEKVAYFPRGSVIMESSKIVGTNGAKMPFDKD